MKKGSIADFAVIALVFFIVMTLAVVGIYIFNTAGTAGASLGSSWTGIMATMENTFIMLGIGLLFFLFLGMIASAYLASQVGSSPALIVIGILVLIPIILLAGGLSLAWTDIASGDLATSASSIPYANIVMDNFVLIVLLGSALLLLALYAGYRMQTSSG